MATWLRERAGDLHRGRALTSDSGASTEGMMRHYFVIKSIKLKVKYFYNKVLQCVYSGQSTCRSKKKN